MSWSPRTTGVVMGAGIVFPVIADLFLAINGRGGDTWTEKARLWSRFTTVVPYASGAIAGHFWGFWLVQHNLALLIWSAWIVLIIGLGNNRWPVQVQCALFLCGFVVGGLLWGRQFGEA